MREIESGRGHWTVPTPVSSAVVGLLHWWLDRRESRQTSAETPGWLAAPVAGGPGTAARRRRYLREMAAGASGSDAPRAVRRAPQERAEALGRYQDQGPALDAPRAPVPGPWAALKRSGSWS